MVQGVEDLGHAPRQRRAREGEPVAHGVAGPYLDRYLRGLGKLHQVLHKGDHEAVKVGARDVLKMAAGRDALFEGCGHDVEIGLVGVLARFVELQKDMVVRAGGEDARFLQAHLFDQLEVLLVGPDPARDLRKAVAALHAEPDRFLVLRRIEEELGLADHALWSAQTVKEIEYLNDLLRRIGRPGLLAVAERRVRHPDLVGHVDRDEPLLQLHPGHAGIGKHIPVEHRLFGVLYFKPRFFRPFLYRHCNLPDPQKAGLKMGNGKW